MRENNLSIENLTQALEKMKSVGALLTNDKKELFGIIAEKKPELKRLFDLIELSKGGFAAVLPSILENGFANNAENGAISSLLPLFINAKSGVKTAEKFENKNEKAAPEKLRKAAHLTPLAKIASGEILKEILIILS